MAGVRIEHVSKRFGEVPVLSGVDLSVSDGEFMVLVGPSGCGKSTLLRIVAGLEEVTSGTVHIGDRDVTGRAPKDRNVAMVFQSYALYPHMSVRDNLGFGLRMARVPRDEIRGRVEKTASTLGLAELLDRKPRQLSGGQRQRVAVGRAIVRDPAVFLFDEPLSNLDAKLRGETRAELVRLQQRLGTTTLYVTHDQVEAMTMGHRIAVLEEGVLQQVGTPLEVYDRPANAFVARFIGTPPMNFLDGQVFDDGNGVDAAGVTIPLSEPARSALRERRGAAVRVGIRPEALGDDPSPTTLQVPGRVEVVEPLGHEVVVHVRVGDALITGKLGAHHLPAVGSTISLALDPERVHFFDVVSGVRLDPGVTA
jgi:multiple sugar transport system ATP-binding protein